MLAASEKSEFHVGIPFVICDGVGYTAIVIYDTMRKCIPQDCMVESGVQLLYNQW